MWIIRFCIFFLFKMGIWLGWVFKRRACAWHTHLYMHTIHAFVFNAFQDKWVEKRRHCISTLMCLNWFEMKYFVWYLDRNVTVCSNRMCVFFSQPLRVFVFIVQKLENKYISFHFYSRNVCVMTKKSIRGFGRFLLLLFFFLRISGSFNLQFSVCVAFHARGFSVAPYPLPSLSHLHIFVHIICDNKYYVNVE